MVCEHRGAFSPVVSFQGEKKALCLTVACAEQAAQACSLLIPNAAWDMSSAPFPLANFFAQVWKRCWIFVLFFFPLQDWVIDNKVVCKSLH